MIRSYTKSSRLMYPAIEPVSVRHPMREGMTLIELLIVVTIVCLLMAISIPLIRYSLDRDKVREGSRQVNMMLAGARTRAIERGRPFGIWLQRSEQNVNAVSELYFCESPAPYVGDLVDARVAVLDLSSSIAGPDTVQFDLGCANASQYVKVGDIIRFNRSGHYFQIAAVNFASPPAGSSGQATFVKIFTESIVPDVATAGSLLFEVLAPPRRLNNSALQLADGVAIDLRHSGIGAEGTQFVFSTGDADHVIIAFDATGAMSYLYFDSSAQDVDGPVHLLIGKLEQIEDADSTPSSPNPISYDSVTNTQVTYDKNLADQASIWVSVGSRNGTLTTAENAWELRPAANWTGIPGPPYFTNSIRRSREFAQAVDAMGGQ